jgi:hypothetical protein
MPVRAVDDKPSDTLVVVSGEGSWTGSSTLPHLHQSTLVYLGSAPVDKLSLTITRNRSVWPCALNGD